VAEFTRRHFIIAGMNPDVAWKTQLIGRKFAIYAQKISTAIKK